MALCAREAAGASAGGAMSETTARTVVERGGGEGGKGMVDEEVRTELSMSRAGQRLHLAIGGQGARSDARKWRVRFHLRRGQRVARLG